MAPGVKGRNDPMYRTGHDAALADLGQWALVRVPAQGVLDPDDSHAFTAIQEIAKRYLQLDVARAEVNEALSAYNHLQSVYDDAYYYARLACITLLNLDSTRLDSTVSPHEGVSAKLH